MGRSGLAYTRHRPEAQGIHAAFFAQDCSPGPATLRDRSTPISYDLPERP